MHERAPGLLRILGSGKRQRLPDRPARQGDRRLSRRNDPRVPAVEPADRFQSPLYDERSDQGGYARCRLCRGGLRYGRCRHVRGAVAGSLGGRHQTRAVVSCTEFELVINSEAAKAPGTSAGGPRPECGGNMLAAVTALQLPHAGWTVGMVERTRFGAFPFDEAHCPVSCRWSSCSPSQHVQKWGLLSRYI